MALVRCPECQREVSDQAQTCPGCGHPLGETSLRPGGAPYRYEFKSHLKIFGLPLIHIIYGPAWLVGFKPARGIIAIGNMAVGVIAIGGLAGEGIGDVGDRAEAESRIGVGAARQGVLRHSERQS